MLDGNTNELLDLLKKYKITINEIGVNDEVKLERYGTVITYSQTELCTKPPKQVVRDIIMKVIQHPEYKAKTMKYVQGLAKKPTIVKSTTLTIDEKKKLIRQKLTKEGFFN